MNITDELLEDISSFLHNCKIKNINITLDLHNLSRKLQFSITDVYSFGNFYQIIKGKEEYKLIKNTCYSYDKPKDIFVNDDIFMNVFKNIKNQGFYFDIEINKKDMNKVMKVFK